VRCYLFDLDGTLLDSMGIWERIDVDFLTMRGLEVLPDYIEAISSMSFPESARYTVDRFGLPESADDLLREWNSMALDAYSHTVPLKPHAKEYLRALMRRGVRLGVATSLPAVLYEAALRNHGIMEWFEVICSTDEVDSGKTKPDVFLLAAAKLGVDPGDCLVFEDSPEAMESAKRAGMTVYGVYEEAFKEQWPLIQQIADGVITDFRTAPLPK
jgi:HAD superfamily hydrolase (TIGR01509 family)